MASKRSPRGKLSSNNHNPDKAPVAQSQSQQTSIQNHDPALPSPPAPSFLPTSSPSDQLSNSLNSPRESSSNSSAKLKRGRGRPKRAKEPYDIKIHDERRKERKNGREKARREKLNIKFNDLSGVIGINLKEEKFKILNDAIQMITKLKQENETLKEEKQRLHREMQEALRLKADILRSQSLSMASAMQFMQHAQPVPPAQPMQGIRQMQPIMQPMQTHQSAPSFMREAPMLPAYDRPPTQIPSGFSSTAFPVDGDGGEMDEPPCFNWEELSGGLSKFSKFSPIPNIPDMPAGPLLAFEPSEQRRRLEAGMASPGAHELESPSAWPIAPSQPETELSRPGRGRGGVGDDWPASTRDASGGM